MRNIGEKNVGPENLNVTRALGHGGNEEQNSISESLTLKFLDHAH